MSNSQNKKNEQQNDLCTTLTEQLKKGELEAGWYYVKNEFENIFISEYSEDYDYIGDKVVKDFFTEVSEITEVIAPVPSYKEWQDTENRSLLTTEFSNEIDELNEENQKLKDVISKMCMELVDPDDDMSNGLAEYFNQDLLLEIHEVLK